MDSSTLMVRDYLESLKEDVELDYLFPILLHVMGYKIIATAKESKGQPQYGKDVVAIGTDQDGLKKRFYFIIKGHAEKNIDEYELTKPNGIISSARAAKYAPFPDSTIPGFNELPVKIVVVHNGLLKQNARQTYEGFVTSEFPNNSFDRWDIFRLTDLFSEYLFSEYLLTDEQSIRLFRRTLVLLDAPDNDFDDFKQLVEVQVLKIGGIKGRSFKKFFATLNLVALIITHYSKENNNLQPAKACLTFMLIRIWSWVLENKLDNKQSVLKEYRKLIVLHFTVLSEYFNKTLPFTTLVDGLFSEKGGPFETVGAPLRAFEYINYLVYYFEAQKFLPSFNGSDNEEAVRDLRRRQKEQLKELIDNNIVTHRPLIDNHSIAILNVFIFILDESDLTQDDIQFCGIYLQQLTESIFATYNLRKRLPELYNNIEALVEFVSTGERPFEYTDTSSLLLNILLELMVVLNMDWHYKEVATELRKINLSLQLVNTSLPDEQVELLMFKKNLHDELEVFAEIKLPDDFAEFKNNILEQETVTRNFRTAKAGFPFLIVLARIYFKHEHFPEEWRKFIPKIGVN